MSVTFRTKQSRIDMLESHTTERQLIEQFLETLLALPEVHAELDPPGACSTVDF
jgi:hypothetical protein